VRRQPTGRGPGALLLAVLAAGCGQTAHPPEDATDLANFTGAPWGHSQGFPVWAYCSTNGSDVRRSLGIDTASSETVTFLSTAPNELEFTSTAGCFFKLRVSLDTAALSNGPVSCGTAYFTDTFDNLTATTTDGHHLTATAAGHTHITVPGYDSPDCYWTPPALATR
jgi:hypothetical protein